MANKNTRSRNALARSAFKKGKATSEFLVMDSRIKNSNGTYGTRTLSITIGAQPRKKPLRKQHQHQEQETEVSNA